MADINKVKSNIKTMIDAGASEQEIDLYLNSEGTTIDDLKSGSSKSSSTSSGDLGTVALVGTGLYAAGKAFFAPEGKIKRIEKRIDNIKKDFLEEPKVSSSSVPARIESKGDIERQALKLKLDEQNVNLQGLRSSKTQLATDLGRQLDEFDNTILNKTIDELGDELKIKAPKFFNQTYDNYGKSLNMIEDKLQKAGKQLNSSSFLGEVIDETISSAIETGVPEDKLGKLFNFRETLGSDRNISIKEMKGNVDSLGKDIPKEAAFRLREKWGGFLERNAPEAADELSTINKSYRKVAQMRNGIYKTIDPQTGEFNKLKLNSMLKAYAQDNVETGLQNTINLMAEGNNIASPVTGVKESFTKLQGAKVARGVIQKTSTQATIGKEKEIVSALTNINKIKQDIEKSRQTTMKWADKANRLLSEQEQIAVKNPIRSGGIGKVIRKGGSVAERATIAQLARKGVGRLAIYPMISAAVHAFSDPVKALGQQIGFDVPDKGTLERAVLENSIPGQEKIPYPSGTTTQQINEVEKKYGLGLST